MEFIAEDWINGRRLVRYNYFFYDMEINVRQFLAGESCSSFVEFDILISDAQNSHIGHLGTHQALHPAPPP